MVAYPLYWLALLFGGLFTLGGFALMVAAALAPRDRLRLGGLAFAFLLVAWVPLAGLFGLLFAMGARPAGYAPPDVFGPATPAAPSTAPFPAPGPGR